MFLLTVFLCTESLFQYLEGDCSFPFIPSTLWLPTELLFQGLFFVFNLCLCGTLVLSNLISLCFISACAVCFIL